MARILPNATSRGRYFRPQSGATTIRSAATWGSACRMRAATVSGVSTVLSARSMTPRMMVFDGSSLQHRKVELGLRRLDRHLPDRRALELRQEVVAGGLVEDDGGIAEADMRRGRALDAVERAVERLDAERLRLLPARLHPRLVDLHDVGAGAEQVLDLGIDGRRVVHGELLVVAVEVVLALHRHGERARHRDLDRAVGMGAQELDVAHLDRMLAPDLADDARHGGDAAAAGRNLAGILQVDAVERGGEPVGVAFPPLLAVGDDVEAGALLVADGEHGGVVLRLLEQVGLDPPQIVEPHPRHDLGQPLPVDQPVGLRIGTDQAGGKEHCGVLRSISLRLPHRVVSRFPQRGDAEKLATAGCHESRAQRVQTAQSREHEDSWRSRISGAPLARRARAAPRPGRRLLLRLLERVDRRCRS